MAVSITHTELLILEYIAECIEKTGCQPSYREICKAFGWSSVNMPSQCIQRLENKGVVEKCGARAVRFRWRSYLNNKARKDWYGPNEVPLL